MKDINYIKKLIPHRFPFLLVDRIIEIDEEHIIARKNVTVNEPFFQGHFPDYPVMPGVLIIEGLAQTSAILFNYKTPLEEDETAFFASIEKAKFRKPVLPGDILQYHIKPIVRKKKLFKVEAKAYVDEELVCEATLMASRIKVEQESQ
ncbi:MAG: 3-hydroxyacyl-ACP dehydratase FabZ [Spirochaetota bacterium]